MLKEYQISNFKAFAGPEILPIKPITLIFGPNSSGKSSILQSILMLKQTLEDSENLKQSLLVRSDLVDLGSYRDFIHRHEGERSFSFMVRLQMPESLIDPIRSHGRVGWLADGDGFVELEKSLEGFQEVGLKISFSHAQDKAGIVVSTVELFLGDTPSPVITYEQRSISSFMRMPSGQLTVKNLNEKHEYWFSHWKTFDESDETYLKNILNDYDPIRATFAFGEEYKQMLTEEQGPYADKVIQRVEEVLKKEGRLTAKGAAKSLRQSLREDWQKQKDRLMKLEGFDLAIEVYKLRSKCDELELRNFLPEKLDYQEMRDHLIFTDVTGDRNLSFLTLSVACLFRGILEKTFYIGPFRNYPERYFTFSGISTTYVGKSGKYVPDILVADNNLLARVNEQFDRFNLGYELKLSSLSDQTTAVHDLFALRLYDKSTGIHVGTTDVGFGFSQVLPVIAQCLLSKQNMILIEQPELHLHPRLQAELGDLFIDSALGDSKNTLIIETHSEHLILRLLRRIRETAEGELKEGQIPIKPDDLAVIYAKPTEEGTKLVHLRVTEDGDFADPWPDGFFSERARELL